MTSPIALPRNSDGSLALVGRRTTLIDVDFGTLTALPAGVAVALTVAGQGSAGIVGAAPTSVLEVATGATSGQGVTVSVPSVDATAWQWLWWQFEATVPANNYPSPLYLGMEGGANMGASWHMPALSFNSRNGDAAITPTPLVTGGTARASRANPGLLILPGRKIIAVTMGEDVIRAGHFPNFVGGVLSPKIASLTGGGVKTLDIHSLRLRGGLI